MIKITMKHTLSLLVKFVSLVKIMYELFTYVLTRKSPCLAYICLMNYEVSMFGIYMFNEL